MNTESPPRVLPGHLLDLFLRQIGLPKRRQKLIEQRVVRTDPAAKQFTGMVSACVLGDKHMIKDALPVRSTLSADRKSFAILVFVACEARNLGLETGATRNAR